MKKIFHIYKTFYPFTHGGVETYIESLQTSAISTYDHYLLSIGDMNFSNEKKIIFKKSFSKFSDVVSFSLFIYLLKKINKKKDIIHLHTPWPSMEIFLNIFGYRKIIVTYHSDIIKQKFLNFFYTPMNLFFLKNNIKKIITTSEIYFITSKILKKIDKNKIEIIPIGLKKINSKQINNSQLKKSIIFIGSNRSYKGINLLENVIKKFNYPFTIIGSNLEHLAKYKNVQYYENASDEKKIELLGHAKFLLMTSTSRNEAFGIVLVEALRSGIPIVSPNLNSGVSWVNKNNYTGYQFETSNLDDLYKKVQIMIDINSMEYQQMQKNCLDRFNAHFTLDKMVTRIDRVYDSL